MNNGLLNEEVFIKLINSRIERGIKNFVFKGLNGATIKYDDITAAIKFNATTTRKNDVFCKADVLLIDKRNRTIPISIKMNESISWESADSTFKDALYDFSNCYGRPILPQGRRVIIPLDGDLTPFVFGDDIIDGGGLICVQKFGDDAITQYSTDTDIINAERIFIDQYDVESDEYYKPCLSVRHDKSRNSRDDVIRGYRAEISPIGNCVSINDIIDDIKFK